MERLHPALLLWLEAAVGAQGNNYDHAVNLKKLLIERKIDPQTFLAETNSFFEDPDYVSLAPLLAAVNKAHSNKIMFQKEVSQKIDIYTMIKDMKDTIGDLSEFL